LRRRQPDESRLVRSLCWLSRLAWIASLPRLTVESADEAVRLATDSADPTIRALALGNRSQVAMLHGAYATAIELGERAVAYAAEAGDVRAMSRALNNVGASLIVIDDGNGGEAELRRSIELALSVGDVESACRGHLNLAWGLVTRHAMTAAAAAAADGLALAIQ